MRGLRSRKPIGFRQWVVHITKQNIAEPSDEWKDIVYHKYNDDRTSYECVPCYNSIDEYIASEKEDLESYKADLEEALEELKDMIADWKPEKEPNMDEEIELIKKWVKEREDFSMNRTRPKQIVIRVSEEELAQIKEKVEQSGKSQQQYIIEALTQSNIVNTDGIKELIPELKRVGNNLNQIAHALNGSSYYSYNLITENQKELTEIWQSLKQFLQKQA